MERKGKEGKEGECLKVQFRNVVRRGEQTVVAETGDKSREKKRFSGRKGKKNLSKKKKNIRRRSEGGGDVATWSRKKIGEAPGGRLY